jgi:hypothetical protein
MPAHARSPGVSRDRRRSIHLLISGRLRSPPRFHFRRRCLSLILPHAPRLIWITQQPSASPSREVKLLLRCLMATSESSLSFVPRRVKATVSRRPPPSVPDRNGAVPPSGASTTSYPKDVLLRVILLAGDGAPRAGDNALRIQRQSRRVLEKLVSHSVDYVHIEDAARGSKANAEVDALERTHVSVSDIASVAETRSEVDHCKPASLPPSVDCHRPNAFLELRTGVASCSASAQLQGRNADLRGANRSLASGTRGHQEQSTREK